MAVGTGLALFLVLFAAYAWRQRVNIARERDLVTREKQTAEQVTEFMVSMFERVNPDLARGGEVTALEVIEQGRQQLNNGMSDQPTVRQRLM